MKQKYNLWFQILSEYGCRTLDQQLRLANTMSLLLKQSYINCENLHEPTQILFTGPAHSPRHFSL